MFGCILYHLLWIKICQQLSEQIDFRIDFKQRWYYFINTQLFKGAFYLSDALVWAYWYTKRKVHSSFHISLDLLTSKRHSPISHAKPKHHPITLGPSQHCCWPRNLPKTARRAHSQRTASVLYKGQSLLSGWNLRNLISHRSAPFFASDWMCGRRRKAESEHRLLIALARVYLCAKSGPQTRPKTTDNAYGCCCRWRACVYIIYTYKVASDGRSHLCASGVGVWGRLHNQLPRGDD